MPNKSALILSLLLLLTANASAHDLWVQKTGDKLALMFGHVGRLETYKPEWVTDVRAYDRLRKPVQLEVKNEKEMVALISKKETAMVSLVLDSGCWIKTVDGWRNISKRGITDYIEASHFIEPVKTIFRWSERFTRPVGTRLEIVPLKNPLILKTGENLPIKVIFEGNPLAGAVVTSHGDPTGIRTGKGGCAQVMIEEKGLQVFGAKHKLPLKDDPDADLLILQANLTFEVK
jgi:nickel transport protein